MSTLHTPIGGVLIADFALLRDHMPFSWSEGPVYSSPTLASFHVHFSAYNDLDHCSEALLAKGGP